MKNKFVIFSILIVVFAFSAISAFAANSPDLSKYTVTYETGQNGELVVINSYTPETKEITIQKQWNDDSNRDGYRPTSICVELKANNVVVDNHTLTGTGNDWSYTFTDKVVYNHGEAITYSANENGTACTALATPTDQNTCLLAGGAWDGIACTLQTFSGNSGGNTGGGSSSSAQSPNHYTDQSSCESAGFHWETGATPHECIGNSISDYVTKSDCESVYGLWINNQCVDPETYSGSQSECEANGYYWYAGVYDMDSPRCHMLNERDACELGSETVWNESTQTCTINMS